MSSKNTTCKFCEEEIEYEEGDNRSRNYCFVGCRKAAAQERRATNYHS